MRKTTLGNIMENSKRYYSKAASLISNKEKREQIIKFLNLYIASEYVAKTIQILLDSGKLNNDVYIKTNINIEKIKSYYCKNGCTVDDLQYVFNPRSHKKKNSCRYIRNKIVHSFDETSIDLILKDDFYVNRLIKLKENFL